MSAFQPIFTGCSTNILPNNFVYSLSGKSVNSAAYDAYMRGKVTVGSENREDNEAAIKLLEQAVKTDPDFALAWAGLARAYNKKSF